MSAIMAKPSRAELGDVGLKEGINFGCRFISTLFDRNGNLFQELCQFQTLLLANGKLTEFLGQGKDTEQVDLLQVERRCSLYTAIEAWEM